MTGFRTVTAHVPDGVTMLGVGLVAAVFGASDQSGPAGFDVVFSAERPGQVMTDAGLPLTVDHGLDRVPGADLVLLLPGRSPDDAPSAAVTAAIRAAHDRGAIIAGHGAACFTLAATGLLDGGRATTHCRLSAELAARHPRIAVEPDVLYVDEGNLVTGAGAVDLYLHLIRRDHGASAANAIERDLVLPPHRDGWQPQCVTETTPDDQSLAPVLSWAMANLHRSVTVEEMAAQALMSARTFGRRFREAVGTTPHAWLSGRRMARAEELLEGTRLSIEEIAQRVGYASGAVLREQFAKSRGLPPREYRRRFQQSGRWRVPHLTDDPVHYTNSKA